MNTLKAKVLNIGTAVTGTSKSGNEYTRRDLTVCLTCYDRDNGQERWDDTNTPQFSFFGDRTRDLDSLNIGDTVELSYVIRGRRWAQEDGTQRIATEVRPLSVRVLQPAADAPTPAPVPAPAPVPVPVPKPRIAVPQSGPQAPQVYENNALQPGKYGKPTKEQIDQTIALFPPELAKRPDRSVPTQPQRRPDDGLPF